MPSKGNGGSIASSLTLDGEQEYKKALNDAYRTLRVLRSELKAETAELGRNASQQDKAKTKTASLQKQIEEQRKIVETLKKALEDSRKEYADNQEVQDKWEEKLNKARETLARMQSEMEDAQDAVRDFSDVMKEAGDESGKAATAVVSLNDSIQSIGNLVRGIGNGIAGIFSNAVGAMEEMVDEMFELMGKAYAAAGEWKEIQTIWGGDIESIEKVFRGASLQGVDTGDITGGIQKLVSNVHSGNKETMRAFKELGIAEDDFESHWDMYIGVMDRLAEMQQYDQQGADRLARMIFGERAGSGQTDVVANWGEMMGRYQRDIEDTGLHLHDDEIENLDAVAHKQTEIAGMLEQMKVTAGARLSDILDMGTLSDDTLDLLRTVAAIWTSDDDEKRASLVVTLDEQIKQLLEDIKTGVENFAGTLTTIGDSLSGSDNSVIAFLGRLIGSFGRILDWVAENGDTIVDALEKLLPWIMANFALEKTTGKGTGEWLDTLTQTGFDIAQIGLLRKALGGPGGSGTAAAAGGGGLLSSAGAWIMSKIPALAQPMMQAGSWLSGLGNNLGPIGDWFFHNTSLGRTIAGQQTWGDLGADVGGWWGGVKENASTFMNDWGIGGHVNQKLIDAVLAAEDRGGMTDEQLSAAEAYWDKYRAGGGDLDWNDWHDFKESFAGADEAFGELVDMVDELYEGGYKGDDLPKEWWREQTDTAQIIKNWLQNKYHGNDADENVKLTVESEVTCPVYLDGNQIATYVSEAVAEKFGRFLGV